LLIERSENVIFYDYHSLVNFFGEQTLPELTQIAAIQINNDPAAPTAVYHLFATYWHDYSQYDFTEALNLVERGMAFHNNDAYFHLYLGKMYLYEAHKLGGHQEYQNLAQLHLGRSTNLDPICAQLLEKKILHLINE